MPKINSKEIKRSRRLCKNCYHFIKKVNDVADNEIDIDDIECSKKEARLYNDNFEEKEETTAKYKGLAANCSCYYKKRKEHPYKAKYHKIKAENKKLEIELNYELAEMDNYTKLEPWKKDMVDLYVMKTYVDKDGNEQVFGALNNTDIYRLIRTKYNISVGKTPEYKVAHTIFNQKSVMKAIKELINKIEDETKLTAVLNTKERQQQSAQLANETFKKRNNNELKANEVMAVIKSDFEINKAIIGKEPEAIIQAVQIITSTKEEDLTSIVDIDKKIGAGDL